MKIASPFKTHNPYTLLASWPHDAPLLFWGNRELKVLALGFYEVSAADWLKQSAVDRGVAATAWGSGYIGVLSYDDFAQRYHAPAGKENSPSRIFRIQRALLWDCYGHSWICEEEKDTFTAIGPRYHFDPAALPKVPLLNHRGHALHALCTDQEYLAKAAAAINDIANGRFYQINLLRYFQLATTPSWAELVAHYAAVDPASGSILRFPDGEMLVSLSPERFVQGNPNAEGLALSAFPIKGTAARYEDPEQDAASAAKLRSSSKDAAELAIIVDLMRNDLNSCSIPGSVKVAQHRTLRSFAHVHHLFAEVRSQFPYTSSFQQLFSALCPAASITGAPKKEVIQAIRSYEGRGRGYFMGNAFYSADTGFFDSSVLIRTLHRERGGEYIYAAGSGLTLRSQPQRELEEITTKCKIITSS